MTGKCFIGWPNRLDSATLSGGSWAAALPLANLQTRRITQPARSANALTTSTKILLDLGENRSLRAFALVNHNLSSAATWRIKVGTTSGGAEVYDSGSLAAWRMTFDADMLEYGDAGWWEGMADDEYLGAPFSVIHVAAAYYTGRYVTIEITDTTNAAGYVQIGRLFVGGGYEPGYNMSYEGMGDQWEDRSTVHTSESGSESYVERRRGRLTRFVLDWLALSEFATVYEMQRRAGTTGELLWVPDVDDPVAQQRAGFLARMRQLNAVEYPYANTRRKAFELGEIL